MCWQGECRSEQRSWPWQCSVHFLHPPFFPGLGGKPLDSEQESLLLRFVIKLMLRYWICAGIINQDVIRCHNSWAVLLRVLETTVEEIYGVELILKRVQLYQVSSQQSISNSLHDCQLILIKSNSMCEMLHLICFLRTLSFLQTSDWTAACTALTKSLCRHGQGLNCNPIGTVNLDQHTPESSTQILLSLQMWWRGPGRQLNLISFWKNVLKLKFAVRQ